MGSGRDAVVRVNTAVTAADVIDGEAVMINLSDGMYYTMAGVGSDVWSLIEQGCSVATMARRLAARYEVDEARAAADVGAVVDKLQAAGLIVLDDDARDGGDVAVDWTGAAGPYAAPDLVSYSDMGDVLALDPPLPRLEPEAGS